MSPQAWIYRFPVPAGGFARAAASIRLLGSGPAVRLNPPEMGVVEV
jgi:hypothetical protein